MSLMQRLIIAGAVIDAACGEHVVDTLWILMESGIEELKVLQTTTLLLTANSVIRDTILSKVSNIITNLLSNIFFKLFIILFSLIN